VYHNASVSTFTMVTVVRAAHVVLRPQTLRFTKPHQFYVAVPVEYYDQVDGVLLQDGPSLKHNVDLTCVLEGGAQLGGLTAAPVIEGNTTYCTIYYSEDLHPLLKKASPTIKATITDKGNSYAVEASSTVSFFPLFVAKEKQIRLSEEKPTMITTPSA